MATATQPEMERRVFDSHCEMRADEDKAPRLVGHAALFNTSTEIMPGFIERIAPGAFSRALSEKQDVRALVDHDPSRVIARTKSGTLKLAEDKVGLRADISPSDTTAGRDITESVRRGDVDQMSFGFISRKETFEDHDDGTVTRTIEDVDLFDVSPVTFPAYDDTSIAVRSLETYKAEAKPQPKETTKVEVNADTRARLAKIEAEAEKHTALTEKLNGPDSK